LHLDIYYMTPKIDAIRLLEESLSQNENARGSLLSAIQKLSRAASLLVEDDIVRWCSIQLGDTQYTVPLQKLLDVLAKDRSEKRDKLQAGIVVELDALGLKQEVHYLNEELNIKFDRSGGGYGGIGFIEESYADLVRTKKGNDGTHYKNNLSNHLNYVRRKSHELASQLLAKVKFSDTSKGCFEILKSVVDDRLLDLNPTLGEQLMLSFKAASSSSSEEWSHALTTCRRILEGVADELYPANSDPAQGKVYSQPQYINRLWAFMDKSIESDANKGLAKAHVDFLGAWIEKANKLTNKGVHAEVSQVEAVKAVFHLYLALADLLDYLKGNNVRNSRPDINNATLDEIEAIADVSRAVAKEIIKARVANGSLDEKSLKGIPGIGVKTLAKITSAFSM
jgi:DNA uptake protein ComE-like DNA-binding protein